MKRFFFDMFLDIAPGGRKKRATRSQIQNVKRGGKIADTIRKISNQHHRESEVPQAEERMDEALESWPEQVGSLQVTGESRQFTDDSRQFTDDRKIKKKTWLQKIQKRFFPKI